MANLPNYWDIPRAEIERRPDLKALRASGSKRGVPFHLHEGDSLVFPPAGNDLYGVKPSDDGKTGTWFIQATLNDTKTYVPIYCLRRVIHQRQAFSPEENKSRLGRYAQIRADHKLYSEMTVFGLSDLDAVLPLLGNSYSVKEYPFTDWRKGDAASFDYPIWVLEEPTSFTSK